MKDYDKSLRFDELGARLSNALHLAKKTALRSEQLFRHGAVLFSGAKVFNSGCNQGRVVGWTSWQAHRFYERAKAQHTMHAEVSAMHNVVGDVIRGADVLVVRVNGEGEFANSRPCSYCERVMRTKGVRNCWYTANDKELRMMRIQNV